MRRNRFLLFFLLLTVLFNSCWAERREIALTIDDLPFVGESKNFHLNMIIDTLKKEEVPATGFIIAKEVAANNWPTLNKFREAGLGLGNHTLSHANINAMNTQAFIQEIGAADRILSPVLTEPKYFRFPYLAMSDGSKKERIQHYLNSKNYRIAPVTIDSKDFVFNQLLLNVPEQGRRSFLPFLKPCYINFIWQQTLKAQEHDRLANKKDRAQILLIHANLLNAYVLPDIINLYRENGYTFVSLTDALKTFGSQEKVAPAPKPKTDRSIENFMAWD